MPEATAEDIAALEAGRLLFARPWVFLTGAAGLGGLPPLGPPEVAIAGRSNVGKSSLINALANRTDLARVSHTPGRTQELNYFAPAPGRGASGDMPPLLLVDMPGYGFAAAPKAKVSSWQKLIRAYLRGRSTLRRVYVLIDGRRGLMKADEEILDLLDEAAVSYQLVLTKADTVPAEEHAEVTAALAAKMIRRPASHPVILATSSRTGAGLPELRAAIAALAG